LKPNTKVRACRRNNGRLKCVEPGKRPPSYWKELADENIPFADEFRLSLLTKRRVELNRFAVAFSVYRER
jgi:hypothetical protein